MHPGFLWASRLAGHVLGMVVGLSLGGWDTAEAVAVPSLVLRSCPHTALVSVAVKTYPRYQRGEASLGTAGKARSSSTATVFGSTRSRMVNNFTSACCASRLARGNSRKRTHSEASSN